MKHFFLIFWPFFGLAHAQNTPPTIPLDGFLRSAPTTFTSDLLANYQEKLQFQWLDQKKAEARFAHNSFTLFGKIPVIEAKITTSQQGLVEGMFLLYSRGDTGNIPEKDFDDLIQKAKTGLDEILKVEGVDRGKDRTGVVLTEGFTWKTPTLICALDASSNRKDGFRSEFIRLTIQPSTTKTLAEEIKRKGESDHDNLPKNVVKSDNGDAFVDHFPMVDQGDKGYCVVASAERMFRYYGMPVDQHELAQLADASAAQGTSPTLMVEKLKPMQNRLRFRIRNLIDSDDKTLIKTVQDYNKLAKQASAHLLPDPEKTHIYSLDNVDATILKTVRMKNLAHKRFSKYIKDYTDKGVPLLWSLALGIFPEDNIPQNAGNHMRIIIGYNTKTDEILYTDSWGAGHELKRMKTDNAWTTTHGLYLLEPLAR